MQPTQPIIVSLRPDTSPYQAVGLAEGIVDAMQSPPITTAAGAEKADRHD